MQQTAPYRVGPGCRCAPDNGRSPDGARLLIVATEAPPIRSGIAEVTRQLTIGLRKLGHEVDHLTVADVGRLQFGEVRLTGLVSRWSQVRRSLTDYDFVNLHGPAPTFSDAFLGLWRTIPARRRPVLVYTHHAEIQLRGARPLCALYNRVHGRLARVADEVVVTTESYRRIARSRGAQRVSVIPHAVECQTSSGMQRAARFTVAFVGQLRPYKGLDVLLRAARVLPDVHFEIAGSGHLSGDLHNLASRLQLRNVTWHGAISDAEREALLGRSHVIALPSTTMAEAFGIVLLEGMSAGAVPIASDLPGVRDVAIGAGLLCRPGDARSLMQAICRLRDDPVAWEARSSRAVALAASYSWDASALGYHSLMAGRMPRLPWATTTDHATSQSLRLAAVGGRALPDETSRRPVPVFEVVGREAIRSGRAVVDSVGPG